MNKMLISKKLITLFLLLVNVFAYSQFVTTGTATSNSLYSGGNIGVGFTTLPVFGTNKFIVTGNSLFTGNTTVNGTGQFANLGLGVLPNTIYRLNVTGNSLFTGNTAFNGNTTVSGTSQIANLGLGVLPNIAFRLNVTGNSLFTGNTAFTGNTTVSGTSQIANLGLGVLPNTAFRLNVIGNSLFTGTTQTTGNVGIGIAPSAALSTKLSLASGIQGLSGLQFSNLTSAFVPTSSTNKFLTVDASGNVVLLNTTQTSGGTTITAGANITATGSPTTGYTISSPSQVLSQSGNTVSLSNGGGSVTFPTSTDSQTLSVAGNQLSISNGNTVTLPTISNENLYNSNGTITNSNGASGRNVNLNNNFLKFSGNEPTTNTNNTITISPFGNTSNPNSDNRSIQEIKSDKYYFPNFDGIGLNTNKVYGRYEFSSVGFENRLTNGFYDSMAWLQVSSKSGTFYGNNKASSSIGALSYLINPLGGNVGIGLDKANPLGTVTNPTAVLHTLGRLRFQDLENPTTPPINLLGTDDEGNVFEYDAANLSANNLNIYNSNGTLTENRTVDMENKNLSFRMFDTDFSQSDIHFNPNGNSVNGNGGASYLNIQSAKDLYPNLYGGGINRNVTRINDEPTFMTQGNFKNNAWLQVSRSNCYSYFKDGETKRFDICPIASNYLINPLGGNVGIGLDVSSPQGSVSTPTAVLHTLGKLRFQNLPDDKKPNAILGTDTDGNVFEYDPSQFGGASQDAWLLNGNANTIPGTLAGQNFLGTTDAKDLVFAVNSDEKFRITQTGRFKFFNNSIGPTWEKNIFIGGGNDNISSQSSNVNYANVAVGLASLMSNTTGYANTATGYNTLKSNTTGTLNAAFGINSMFNNTIGLGNVSMGHNSLYENINGNTNTAIGNQSLVNNKNGSNNTAIGSFAGNNLIQGNNNIFIGVGTLSSNSNISNELNIGNWIFGKNGQIAIGSFTNLPQSFITNNDYQLIVKKGIRTEKVRVDIASVKGWADYVFAKDYSLMPLKDLEKFIKINGHLPNIPKAEEVVKEGIDLGAMDAKLLEKIEELTIHTIELNKKNEALEKEKIKQAKLIDDLAKRLEKLEKNTKQ